MVAPNGIRYLELTGNWYCGPCKRSFVSKQAIHSHCRHAVVHLGQWCERCEWLFGSQVARTSHHQNSRRHNICPDCEVDFLSCAGLDYHLEQAHYYCNRCKEHIKDPWGGESQDSWRCHQAEVHFLCTECDTYFQNQNNLDQHKRVHLQPQKCYGCSRKFASLSSMMIHLESGACSSQISVSDINRWASVHLIGPKDPNRYECPKCEGRFRFFSGLLQHLESNACEGDIEHDLGCLYIAVKFEAYWHVLG